MTDIPEWAEAEARELSAIGCGCDDESSDGCINMDGYCRYQEFMISRALAATAVRVERETIERSRALAKTAWLTAGLEMIMDADHAESLSYVTSEAIASIPLKYQEQS